VRQSLVVIAQDFVSTTVVLYRNPAEPLLSFVENRQRASRGRTPLPQSCMPLPQSVQHGLRKRLAGTVRPPRAPDAKRLKEIARRQKITHSEIAKRAGTSRTRVTAILNDDIEHVSSDLLIRILASLAYRVKVSVVRSDSAA
jgi:hypothetical protein